MVGWKPIQQRPVGPLLVEYYVRGRGLYVLRLPREYEGRHRERLQKDSRVLRVARPRRTIDTLSPFDRLRTSFGRFDGALSADSGVGLNRFRLKQAGEISPDE